MVAGTARIERFAGINPRAACLPGGNPPSIHDFEETTMSLRPISTPLLLLSLSLSVSGAAFASPVTDEANLHFKAIAGGDVLLLMRGYDKDASLQWVGGPLAGVYKGDARLRELWAKFRAPQGQLETKGS